MWIMSTSAGLQQEMEQVRDAVELPFLHPHSVFRVQVERSERGACCMVRLDAGKP